ncbi:type II toxin-antitoxin system HicB family antitoxin [Clostridium ihumii]|uniref:type II toxin-antitoxin system HicB family antitoxin n=1 Tax=Clostridium ihumii TaxID=1470356 RepID=UPI003D343079
MYKENYIFPAIVEKLGKEDYNIKFLDFDYIISYGETLSDAFIMAEDALKMAIFDLYEEKKEIPQETLIDDIKVNDKQILILVKVNLKDILKEYDNKAVKKTLTIPSWLNKKAEENDIKFSQLLQEALKSKLNL